MHDDNPWADYDDQPPIYDSNHPPVFAAPDGITPLGYDHGVFYYLSRASRQVIPLPASQHSKNALMALASVPHFWQRTQFVNDKGQIQWDDATDWLMSQCRSVGIYDSDKLRGRGAWIDEGRAVLHLGNQLIVDGHPKPLELDGSKYVYEAAKPLSDTVAQPLSTRDAHQLIQICQGLRWERGLSGTLLAGWLAVAPICGGLAWRPSIWITGGSGSGKSYLTENIVAPATAGIALRVLSKTSEAGIRQALGSDARPVLFDEAEREDSAAAVRMQGVLDLVRQAASESGAEIIKGSQTHAAKRFRIRSAFCFSSINVGIEHQADESRMTVLALRTPKPEDADKDAANFRALNELVQTTLTSGFSFGLVARSVRLLPVIRENAETFAQAVALHLGSRRTGDQIGALLAGAYSLHSERSITAEEALAYIQRQEWEANTAAADTERDEYRLLTTITQARVRYAPGNGTVMDLTLGRLIEAAWGKDDRISSEQAEIELRANGLRTDGLDAIFVSNNHPALKKLLIGSPWATAWNRSLTRLSGVENSTRAVRFGAMHQSKAVRIPRYVLEGG